MEKIDYIGMIQSYAKMLEDRQSTVICHPSMESRIKDLVRKEGMGHFVEVVSSTLVDADELFILNSSLDKLLEVPIPMTSIVDHVKDI